MLQGIKVNCPIGMSIKIQLFLIICQGMAEFFRFISSENWETKFAYPNDAHTAGILKEMVVYKYEKVMIAAF